MALRRLAYHLAWRLHRLSYRLGTRFGRHSTAADTLLLRTVGRRSGQTREALLRCVQDASGLVVVASNAGADHAPAWWLNLRAMPDAEVEIGGQRRDVRARVADQADAERLWARLVAAHPGFDDYQRRTTRRIPVVVLVPRRVAPSPTPVMGTYRRSSGSR